MKIVPRMIVILKWILQSKTPLTLVYHKVFLLKSWWKICLPLPEKLTALWQLLIEFRVKFVNFWFGKSQKIRLRQRIPPTLKQKDWCLRFVQFVLWITALGFEFINWGTNWQQCHLQDEHHFGSYPWYDPGLPCQHALNFSEWFPIAPGLLSSENCVTLNVSLIFGFVVSWNPGICFLVTLTSCSLETVWCVMNNFWSIWVHPQVFPRVLVLNFFADCNWFPTVA